MPDLTKHAADGRLRICRAEGVSVHILRLWRPQPNLLQVLAKALGAPPPTTPNTTSGGTPRLLWMGPEEWAVLDADPGLPQRVTEACGNELHHLSDVTDGRVILMIEGPAAPDLLAKGCSLDFHPRAFAAGACARSLFAQLPVLIERPGEAFAFRLIFDRTHLAHLDAWLNIAAAELLETVN